MATMVTKQKMFDQLYLKFQSLWTNFYEQASNRTIAIDTKRIWVLVEQVGFQ